MCAKVVAVLDTSARLLRLLSLLQQRPSWTAAELAEATGPEAVTREAADLLYFLLVKTTATGIGLDRVEAELDRRELRVTRRPMAAKEETS